MSRKQPQTTEARHADASPLPDRTRQPRKQADERASETRRTVWSRTRTPARLLASLAQDSDGWGPFWMGMALLVALALMLIATP
jgi:hypothetical protein